MINRRFYKQSDPVKIPVPGNKVIEEHFGRVSTKTDGFSVAHMKAPPRWSEPGQIPEFDEITIVIEGELQIEVANKEVVRVSAGESFFARKGVKVRYSNPADDPADYWAFCIPAFDSERANRENENS